MEQEGVAPVKWFIAILFKDEAVLERALSRLADSFCAIDFRSPSFPFTLTDYYQPEMGTGLRRMLASFSMLAPPDRLISLKTSTASLEKEYSREGKRAINIDPGYLDLFKVVLASFKGRGNKIYLGQGIWADFTLYYQKGAFYSFQWSFPDFKSGIYNEALKKIRDLYKRDLALRQ